MNEIRTNKAKGSVELAVLVRDYERLTAINTDYKARLASLEPRVRYVHFMLCFGLYILILRE